jgi:hypothetical protein
VARDVICRLPTVERRLGLAFTTLTIFAPLAQAAHPQQAIKPEGTASPLEFVATAARSLGGPRDVAFARQVLPARDAQAALISPRARSRVIYLNRDGVVLRPGDNDAARDVSSIVARPTALAGWDVDDDTWAETFDCIAELYAPFDVEITDDDPGDVPHIEAVFGGHPRDVGLPDNVGGVSPFTTDCAVIEHSIVFAFTDVLPADPRTICEVMAQEIAHSYGLDHEMLPSDPMTYLDYPGERSFQDTMASCGEFEARKCGINGNMCRQRQNSVQLLEDRLGPRGGGSTDDDGGGVEPDDRAPDRAARARVAGCPAGGGGAGVAMALAYFGLRRRRRRG